MRRRVAEQDAAGTGTEESKELAPPRCVGEHYQRRLSEERITCSMSRRGDCWDNAPVESFFASLKKELVHHEDYAIS